MVACFVEERTAQVVARKNQLYFSSLLDSTPDLCVISNLETYAVEYLNKAGVTLAAVPDDIRRDLNKIHITDILPELRTQLHTFRDLASRVLEGEGEDGDNETSSTPADKSSKYVWSGRTTLVTLNGEHISVDASMVYMKGVAEEEGVAHMSPSYIAVLARDVGSTIKSEAELIAAKRANEAKSNFLSSSSYH